MSNQKDARPKTLKTEKSMKTVVKYYLVAYNIFSTLGWSYILLVTLVHLLDIDGRSSTFTLAKPQTASSTLARLFTSIPYLKSSNHVFVATVESIPLYLRPLFRRAVTTYTRVGAQTAIIQSFAALEVLHVLLKWVRSPIQTTAMQVSSRLYIIWGITEQFEVTHTNPIYASMVFAWSATEVIRYTFYACNLLGYEPYSLLYLRYTTFYALYLIGAPSEACLIYATLPKFTLAPWMEGLWGPGDYFRAALFIIWWPSLYVMYTHMIKQRRKIFGGQTLGSKAKSKSKAQ